MKTINNTIICTLLLLALTACQTKQDVGIVTGGAIGGAVGSQFGGGSGKTIAIIAGTLIGASIGGSIGKSMDDVDRMKMAHALETSPTRQSTQWRNPDTGASYSVTPTATYQNRLDQPCREYTTTAVIDGKREQIYGTACRQSNGSWKVIQ